MFIDWSKQKCPGMACKDARFKMHETNMHRVPRSPPLCIFLEWGDVNTHTQQQVCQPRSRAESSGSPSARPLRAAAASSRALGAAPVGNSPGVDLGVSFFEATLCFVVSKGNQKHKQRSIFLWGGGGVRKQRHSLLSITHNRLSVAAAMVSQI